MKTTTSRTIDTREALAQCAAYNCTGCPYRATGCVISLIEEARASGLLDKDGNIVDKEEA